MRILFREHRYMPCFSAIFSKADNFLDFLFTSLGDIPLHTGIYHIYWAIRQGFSLSRMPPNN